MWLLIVAFLVFIVLVTLSVFLVNKVLSVYVERHIGGRLDAIDEIVNEEQVPQAWLRPYRARADKLRASGAIDARIAKLSDAARKRCLVNIQELIRYVEDVNIADNEATKRYMLSELRKQEAAWQDEAEWQQRVGDLSGPSES
jgi:hypothetical protein